MPKPHHEYLQHILEETQFVLATVKDVRREDFLKDEVLKRAFVRSLEIIGEATKQLPPEVTAKHPDVDWKGMAAVRDKLIHHYFGVDYEIVWDIIRNKLPPLSTQLEKILQEA